MKKILVYIALIFVIIACSPMVTIKKTADGRYEQTVSNYHCDLNINDDCFSTYKDDSTNIINDTDVCNKCGRIFSEHETNGDHYQKDATDKNWL